MLPVLLDVFFFFQAEDGIRDPLVTGVQTCLFRSYATKYDPKTKFVFKADALYLRGSANGVKQVDKAAADARGEYALSDRTFAFGEVNYLRDPFKGMSYF